MKYLQSVVRKGFKATLQKIQRSLPMNKLKSDTIPMYTLKGHNDLDRCLTSCHNNTRQLICPFVGVSVKGQTVLIRKTISIWLFQENECVSPDRIFRVRLTHLLMHLKK